MSASNTRLTLTISDLNSQGEGVARLGRDVYFVAKALPDEQVEVVLDGRRRKVWQTRLLKVLTESPQRVTPICGHYQRCGGCDMQHLAYAEQVAFKQTRVQREFARQQVTFPEFCAPIAENPWHYRRKARIGVRYSPKTQKNIVGFREAASSHLTNIDQCPVLPEHPALDWNAWRECIQRLQGRALITQIEMTDADNALALVLRILKPLQSQDKEALCAFATSCSVAPYKPLQLWLKTDKQQAPELLFPDHAESLLHHVEGTTLQVQLDDFMQVNAAVNQRMVAQSLDWLELSGNEVVWDMYAGHGNFSLPLAKRVQQVYAFEGSEAMVSSLNRQAQTLGLPVQAQVMDLTQADFAHLHLVPDVLLLDPPRAGALELMSQIIASNVPKILYVACDAATMARDLFVLQQAGYVLKKAGIMDMFPQTHHVETMVLLEYKP